MKEEKFDLLKEINLNNHQMIVAKGGKTDLGLTRTRN